MIYKKEKCFNPADNTVLDCPSVDYKINRDTYRNEKILYLLLSIIMFVVALLVIIFSKSYVMQTIASVFMGGILSILVWLLTIRQQDKINFQLATIDMNIMAIDEHLEFINSKVAFINPDEYGLVGVDSKHLVYRFMFLFQLTVNLDADKMIESSDLKLKFSDDNEYSLHDYIDKCESICMNKFAGFTILQDKWEKVIELNLYTIDRHLKELKKKLLRYKMYINYGNVPQRYRK